MHGTGAVTLRTTNKSFCEEFKEKLRILGFHVYAQVVKPKKPNRAMLFEARGCSKTFYEWYKNPSFEKIKEIAEEYPASFIRGFFQSEGSITKDGRVFMASTDSQIVDIVRCVLNKLGFRSSYYPLPTRYIFLEVGKA